MYNKFFMHKILSGKAPTYLVKSVSTFIKKITLRQGSSVNA